MTPTWYDILGVQPSATAAEIKAAWRDATDKFEPGTGAGQFRMFNDAADVLLDPEKRAAYDAELGVEPDETPAPEPEPEAEVPAPTKVGPLAVLSTTLGLAVLAVLTVCSLVLVVVLGTRLDSKAHDAEKNPVSYAPSVGAEAASVAERAIAAALAYNYQHMEQDRDAATKFMTPAYGAEYTKNFDGLLKGNAQFPGVITTKTVVTASNITSAVMDVTKKTVRVLVFVDQVPTRAGKPAQVLHNRVIVTMVQQNGQWLLSNLDPLAAGF